MGLYGSRNNRASTFRTNQLDSPGAKKWKHEETFGGVNSIHDTEFDEQPDSPIDEAYEIAQALDVIRIDKNCVNCTGNPSQALQMLKLACISYTSSPITYREKKYHVSELLKIKAGVIADC
jgi:hypothetical protein